MNGWRALLMPALWALLAPALASTLVLPGSGEVRVPLVSVHAARFATTLQQRFDFSCGSAALATLLSYHYGRPVAEQDVFEAMYARGDQRKIRVEGFSLLDMKRYLADLGYAADGFRQPLASLARAGLPAIVLIEENGYRHFVVVKGLRDERVLLGDPSAGTRALPRRRFEQIWVNRLLFVVHDHRAEARFNAPLDWRAAPRAPLGQALVGDGLGGITMPKFGPGDF